MQGHATSEGTNRYSERLCAGVPAEHFRKVSDLSIGSIGIGTYLGQDDDETDALVIDALVAAVRGGVNLIDTAINYRFERAECAVGEALRRLVDSGAAARDELVVCTKGGYLPCRDDPAAWFEREYIKGKDFGIKKSDLAGGIHCLHPAYIYDQLERSLANMGIESLDVYYLHNPEAQLGAVSAPVFRDRLQKAFEVLEAAVSQSKISYYGLATWNAFRTGKADPGHLELADCKTLAREAAGGREDHLRFVQLPFNLAMPEALLATQQSGDEQVPIIEAARQMGIDVVASASIYQAQLTGKIPALLVKALGKDLSDAQRALQFTRSAPGFACALVGMKQPGHVAENLALLTRPPLDSQAYLEILKGAG
ncbi:MAG TPA: aldo/keto reductase [Myxococcota bacterium]|nr:aldo/keto reductase [Myxococcota bacterium]